MKERKNDIKLNYKEVFALIIAAYRVVLPKVSVVFVSLIVIYVVIKLCLEI